MDTWDVIHDIKTTGSSPAADAAHKSQQLTTYALASRVLRQKKERHLRLTFLVETKGGKRKVVQQDTTRTAHDISVLLLRMRATLDAIKAGVATPTNPTNWWCSAKWCGYWDICPFAERTAQ